MTVTLFCRCRTCGVDEELSIFAWPDQKCPKCKSNDVLWHVVSIEKYDLSYGSVNALWEKAAE